MQDLTLIEDILIILLVSIPIIFLFKKLSLPSIIGFIIVGIIIGPYGFKLIHSNSEIDFMAEIGVILLLFTIGLEVSYSNLIKLKKYLIYTGSAQIGVTVLIAFLVFYFLNLPLNKSFFLSMTVALSSTAVVLKFLSDRNELAAPQGKISVGILIFQDLMIVPMFLILPLLGGGENNSISDLFINLGISFGSLLLLVVIARYLMPKLIFQLASLKLNEAFTVGIILILLGTAYLTHSAGLSFALGAFIAGLILAETDFHSHILADILPLKDTFNTIFFVSVGLLLDLSFIIENPVLIIAVTLAILFGKTIIIMLIVLIQKYPLRIAILTGIGLAQIGEFSFILAKTGLDYNLIDVWHYKTLLSATIISIICTPFLIRLTHKLTSGNNLENVVITSTIHEYSLKNHVIIVGYGLNGKSLAKVLKETGINYLVVEMNPYTVKAEKEKKENIIFGDISRLEILSVAQIKSAKVIVFTIPDPVVVRRGVRLAKSLNDKIFTVVRTRFINEIDSLKKNGADVIIPEELESSLEIFKRVLEYFHIPMNIIMKQTSILRKESYGLLRSENTSLNSFIHIDEILAEGLTEIYYVNGQNNFIGKSLREIDLRKKTGTTILAIVRHGKNIVNPGIDETLNENDTLVLTGNHLAVDNAIELLNAGFENNSLE